MLKSFNRVSNNFIHVTDLLPTLAFAANITINDKSLDGVNQWESIISTESPSTRNEVLYNIENVLGVSAIVNDGWKLVNGSENINFSDWFGSTGATNFSFQRYARSVLASEASESFLELNTELIYQMREQAKLKCNENDKAKKCDPLKAPCLFNIIEDPCEQNNLADLHEDKVEFLTRKINDHIKNMIPSGRRFSDPNCDPKNFNFTWTWWEEDETSYDENGRSYNLYMYIFCTLLAVIVIFLSTLFIKHKSKKTPIKVLF